MRLLFYTATCIFLVLSGCLAYYALQMPEQNNAPKVVLSIEANEIPAAAENVAEGKQVTEEYRSSPSGEAQIALLEERNLNSNRTPQDSPGENVAGDRYENESGLSPDRADAGQTEPDQGLKPESSSESRGGDGLPLQETISAVEEAPKAAATDESSGAEQELPGTAVVGFSVIYPDSEGTGATEATGESEVTGFRRGFARNETQGFAYSEPSDTGLNRSAPLSGDSTSAVQPPAAEEEDKLAALPEKEQADIVIEQDARINPQPDSVPPAATNLSVSAPQTSSGEENPVASPEAGTEAATVAEVAPAQSEAASPDGATLNRDFEAFLESRKKPEPEGQKLALVTPPPFPLRRPEGAPPPKKPDPSGGWAGTQFVTTEVATVKLSPKPTTNSVRVAILLRGVGRDDRNSESAVKKLPSAISLAVMPLSAGAQRWATQAREAGHEVLVQLPLEPSDYPTNNPGPETLLTSAGSSENLRRLRAVLGRFAGCTGVTNYLGGRILQSGDALRPILENLKSEGLVYVGEGNRSHDVVRRLAREIGLRYGDADIIIDAQPTSAAIKQALDRLVALARKDGNAIGMAYASRTTIEQLEAWSQSVSAQGITLVPVGALAQTPGAS